MNRPMKSNDEIIQHAFSLGVENLGAHIDKCTTVVGKAAAWATELILDEMDKRELSLEENRLPKYRGR